MSDETWFVEHRLAWIKESVEIFGQINRDNICRKFGISTLQASLDLRKALERWPDIMTYNKSTSQRRRSDPGGIIMDKRTRAALEGSIAKWQAIADGTKGDKGPSNCALCRMFWNDSCINCPVRLNTGIWFCEETPYTLEWESLIYTGDIKKTHKGRVVLTDKAIAAAIAERDFLISLRDPEPAERDPF